MASTVTHVIKDKTIYRVKLKINGRSRPGIQLIKKYSVPAGCVYLVCRDHVLEIHYPNTPNSDSGEVVVTPKPLDMSYNRRMTQLHCDVGFSLVNPDQEPVVVKTHLVINLSEF
jgi:hypothetical protein